jgi:CRISPR-associated protein Csb2
VLAIDVELLFGTFRGSGPDDLALTGRAVDAEWPPSPARLFAALVGGGGTRARQAPGCATEVLRRLEVAAPPRILADTAVLRSTLAERFVVRTGSSGGAVQQYVARVAEPVRPGVRLAPRTPRVGFAWDDLELTDGDYESLRRRAARVGYLGCSDTPVRVTAHRSVPATLEGLPEWLPDMGGTRAVAVPFDGFVDVLDQMFDSFSAGEPVRRSWFRTEQVWYHDPGREIQLQPEPRPAVWLRLARPVSPRLTVALTSALRAAVLSRYDLLYGPPPAVLHGHGGEPDGHAQFLALPHVGFLHADGRHRGASVSFPIGTADEVVSRTRLALAGVERIVGRGVNVGVELHDGAPRPLAARPERWRGPSRRWVSALPVVHERYLKGRTPALADVAEWCRHAGLPAPRRVQLHRLGFAAGVPNLPAQSTVRPGGRPHPYSHLQIEFPEPISGPVAIGRMRHFGLGLLLPAGTGDVDE